MLEAVQRRLKEEVGEPVALAGMSFRSRERDSPSRYSGNPARKFDATPQRAFRHVER